MFFFYQKHFAWEAPGYCALYEECKFDWMKSVSALKRLIYTAGFVVKFMDMTTFQLEPTEGDILDEISLLSLS